MSPIVTFVEKNIYIFKLIQLVLLQKSESLMPGLTKVYEITRFADYIKWLSYWVLYVIFYVVNLRY